MGCDFLVRVQARYGTIWVDLLRFGTKTRCGGYPIVNAFYSLEKASIGGHYGREFLEIQSVTEDFDEVTGAVILARSGVNALIEIKNKLIEDFRKVFRSKWLSEEENDDDAGADVDAEADAEADAEYIMRKFVYYSKDQFKLLVDLVKSKNYEDDLYVKCLHPLLAWCDMVMSAYPLPKYNGVKSNAKEYSWFEWSRGYDVWMSEFESDTAEVTKDIVTMQNILKEKYQAYLADLLATKLSPELICLIAEYALPVADDIRVAINDDEDNASRMYDKYAN